MKRTRLTAEQINRKFQTAEQLIAQSKIPAYIRWRKQYGGMQAEEARCLILLEN